MSILYYTKEEVWLVLGLVLVMVNENRNLSALYIIPCICSVLFPQITNENKLVNIGPELFKYLFWLLEPKWCYYL